MGIQVDAELKIHALQT